MIFYFNFCSEKNEWYSVVQLITASKSFVCIEVNYYQADFVRLLTKYKTFKIVNLEDRLSYSKTSACAVQHITFMIF